MANYVGSLEADLQAATEYAAGGVGPLFKQERIEEPFALPEFLNRVAAALRKLKITNAVTLFVDDQEIYTADDEATGNTLDSALEAARAAGTDEGIGFYLMLSYQDKEFSHIISVEGAVDHPADISALVVLDVATVLDDDEVIEGVDEGDEEMADGASYDPIEDHLSEEFDENMQTIELIERFLGRIQAELDKELALADPEIDVWIDWDNAYAGLNYGSSSALPGLPGV